MWQDALAMGELNRMTNEQMEAEQAAAAQAQAQADPFGEWMSSYDEQTDTLAKSVADANKRAMFLNIGASLLGNIEDPGQAGAQALQHMGSYYQGKAGIEGLRADREDNKMDQSVKFSQYAKNLSSAQDDNRSWSEKRFDMQVANIMSGLDSGLYGPEEAHMMFEQALGANYRPVEIGNSTYMMSPTGKVLVNGKWIDPSEAGNMRQTVEFGEAAASNAFEDAQAEAQRNAKIDYLMNTHGISRAVAGMYVGNPMMWDKFGEGYVPPNQGELMEAGMAPVEEIRAWLLSQAQSQKERDLITNASPEQIEEHFKTIQ
jgi:hypothetical protein